MKKAFKKVFEIFQNAQTFENGNELTLIQTLDAPLRPFTTETAYEFEGDTVTITENGGSKTATLDELKRDFDGRRIAEVFACGGFNKIILVVNFE